MNFPLKAVQTLLGWLRGTETPSKWEVYLAIEALTHWAAELVLNGGVFTTLAFETKTDTDIIEALEALETQHAIGATFSATAIPTWLLPILAELLMRLLKQ